MIQMSVSQDYKIDTTRVKGERLEIASPRGGMPLEHSAVHEKAGLRCLEKKAGASYLLGSSTEGDVHGVSMRPAANG
jgi:hypothetical protein